MKRLFAAALFAAGTALAQQPGGTAILVVGADPATLNPNVSVGVPDVLTGCILNDGLVRFASGFKVVPSLAKSWTISPDGKRLAVANTDSGTVSVVDVASRKLLREVAADVTPSNRAQRGHLFPAPIFGQRTARIKPATCRGIERAWHFSANRRRG